MSLFAELKRRNVIRVAMLYAVAGWVLLQVGDLLFGALGVPAWGIKLLFGLLLLGFPMAVVFAWVYELTPEGLKREHEVDRNASITRETASKLNLLVAVLLVAAIGLLLADRFIPRGKGTAVTSPATADSAAALGPLAVTPATTVAAAAASIAVLPFVNMSDDKANEYFSDGLTEELLNVLANVPGLRVIARTSSFAYKGKEVKIADVAHDLNVDHVLEGSVRKSGNRVRITTQLIRSSDSSHLWSQTYDRDLNDIFAVQDEISSEVVDALKVKLLKPAVSSSTEAGGTHDPAAYEAYLRGRHLRLDGGEGESTLRGAIAAFDEAVRIDPQYARAYAGMADAHNSMASNGYVPFESGFMEARESAERALELAPDLSDALLPLAYIQLNVDARPAAAHASVERAMRLSPGSIDVQLTYSGFAASMGWHDRSVASARKALELDPIAPRAHVNLAGALAWAGQLEEAERVARNAISLAPGRSAGHFALGYVLLLQGRADEAIPEFDQESITWQRMFGRAMSFARLGKPDLARDEIQAMRNVLGDAASYQYAAVHAALGDRDEAFRWLARAREVRDPGLMGQVYFDPFLEPIRTDPRYATLVRELGFETVRSETSAADR
jgi:TolB-like protein/tetratricopeptide (TPR) repeat protein